MIDFDADPLDDESPLGDEFPLGDGTAETEATLVCPYCGEANEITLDAAGGMFQEYEEDCQVCCKPWLVTVAYNDEGEARVTAVPLDD